MEKRFKNWKPPVFDEDGWAYPDRQCMSFKQHKYGWRCQYHEGLKLGKNIDIGTFAYFNAKFGIEIGDNVQMGSHCSTYSHNTENQTQGKVVIGKGALIGSHCLILPGAVIKPGEKIRAFSIVKRKK